MFSIIQTSPKRCVGGLLAGQSRARGCRACKKLLLGGGALGFLRLLGFFALFETAANRPLVSLRSTALRLAFGIRLAFGKSTAAQLCPVLNLAVGANSCLAALFTAPPKCKVKVARLCLALCNL